MSAYLFSEDKFKKSFLKSDSTNTSNIKLYHTPGKQLKLFPYKGNEKPYPIINMSDVVGDFIRAELKIKPTKLSLDELCKGIQEEIGINDSESSALKAIIKSFFFRTGEFIGDNIGMYQYNAVTVDGANELTHFLRDILSEKAKQDKISQDFNKAAKNYPYNVLENLIKNNSPELSAEDEEAPYFKIFDLAAKQFSLDIDFMLTSGMTSTEDLSNLLSLYYFYYTSQTCIVLNQFGNGVRNKIQPVYFSLDWEKMSTNRKAYTDGWRTLQENIKLILSHSFTLDLLNQTQSNEKYDYIKLVQLANGSSAMDFDIAKTIKGIEETYTKYVTDYGDFKSIPREKCPTQTETAIRHLFDCVNGQFKNTSRKRVVTYFYGKLTDFYKERWLKNRGRAGWVLNLTQADIIFLTKLSIRDGEQIRLIELFKEYEKRGVFLDNTSKTALQDLFQKLNLLDKKSDSGDAQYVRKIL